MMYSEFITITGWDESYMTYNDYTEWLEQAYNDSRLDKYKWCRNLYKAYTKYVYTPTEMAISAKMTEDKVDYINGNADIMNDVKALEMTLKATFLKAVKNSITIRKENNL